MNSSQSSDSKDKNLILAAQGGNNLAFDRLMMTYRGAMFGIINHYVDDTSLADDIYQDALLRVYLALPQFQFHSRFYTWLYRITLNTAHTYVRLRKRKLLSMSSPSQPLELLTGRFRLREYSTPENETFSEELENQFIDVILNLPDDMLQTIVMREVDGKSYDEIAEILHCPIGTIRSRICRARRLIDREIGPLLRYV